MNDEYLIKIDEPRIQQTCDAYFKWKDLNTYVRRLVSGGINMPDAINEPMECYCLDLMWNKSIGGDAQSKDGRKIEFKATSNYEYDLSSFGPKCDFDDLGFIQTNKCEGAYANEFDKYAVETYEKNFELKVDCRDIHQVKLDEIPEFDIMVGGFPCTSFSVGGYRKGFEDDRTGDLFFEMERIFKIRKPRVVFLENVKNLVGHDNGKTFRTIIQKLEEAGYKDKIRYQVLNACGFGNIPQNRERIYIVAFKEKEDYDNFQMPMSVPLSKTIKDVFEFNKKWMINISILKENIKVICTMCFKLKWMIILFISGEENM